jgi:hypothetical protein
MTAFGSFDQLLRALADHDFSGQDEQAIREQWIYPLLMLLGYGVGTFNGVDIPFKVDLAAPVRALGSKRWEIDYRPTVHGVGLWIIEAKRPDENLFSEQHIGQAWGYATHPKVDVPFMVLANGVRLCVFDLTQDEWDKPLLDIQQSELPERFGRLEAMLGARQVAEFVRRHQLRHLRRALAAQLDDEALDQTLHDVQAIVDEARPQVNANRAAVSSEAWAEFFRRQQQSAKQIGISGLAFAANGPNMMLDGDLARCAEMVLECPPDQRVAALEEMLSVARVGATLRQTLSLRLLRLGVVLRCVGYDGCDEIARQTAEEIVRDAAERFPSDPVSAAGHDFERVLAAFLARLLLVGQTDAAKAAVEKARRTFDVERFLRDSVLEGLSAEAMLGQGVALLFRQVWTSFEPWTVEAISACDRTLQGALTELPPARDVRIGQVGNANFEMHLQFDPLRPGTRNVLLDLANPVVISSDDPPQRAVQQAFCVELLKRYLPEESE